MKVLAFSCAHLASPLVQRQMAGLYTAPAPWDYGPFLRLLQMVQDDETITDLVNLGDLSEPFYDRKATDLEVMYGVVTRRLARKRGLRVVNLAGNHDPGGGRPLDTLIDGVRYEHGHASMKAGHFEPAAIHAFYEGQPVVHGHSHVPKEGWGFDVGSVTFTGTCAIVENGQPRLVRL